MLSELSEFVRQWDVLILGGVAIGVALLSDLLARRRARDDLHGKAQLLAGNLRREIAYLRDQAIDAKDEIEKQKKSRGNFEPWVLSKVGIAMPPLLSQASLWGAVLPGDQAMGLSCVYGRVQTYEHSIEYLLAQSGVSRDSEDVRNLSKYVEDIEKECGPCLSKLPDLRQSK